MKHASRKPARARRKEARHSAKTSRGLELRPFKQELSESEKKFRSLYTAMHEGVSVQEIVSDKLGRAVNCRIIDVNPAYERIVGLKREVVVGRLATEIFGIKEVPNLGIYAKVVSTGKTVNFETYSSPLKKHFSVSVFPYAKGKFATIFTDITTPKQVEERLRESEERYRSLFERMLDGVYLSTHEGRFVDVNPAFVKMFGYSSRDEMLKIPDIGKTLYFSPEERGRHIPEAAESGVEVFPMRRKDGSMIWVEDHGGYIHDRRGTVIFHEGILRDVTERKRMEETLAKERNVLRQLIDNLPDNIFIKDEESRFVVSNLAHARLLRAKTPDEIVGKTDFDVFPRKLAESYYADEQAVIRADQPLINREERTVDPAGKTRWLLTTKVPLRDDHGKVIGIAGINRDITERKQMEEELRKSTQFLETIIQSADVWLDVIDHEGNVLIWNKAAESISGYSHAEVVAHRKIWEWLYPDEKYRKEIMDSIPNPQHGLETQIRRKDGETRIISWYERWLTGENGKNIGSIVIGRDITDEKRMQNEIKRYSEHLQEMVEERTKQLTESEMRFRDLANLLPQTVYEVDHTGNFTFVNHSGLSSLGYTEEEAHSGLNALEVFVEQDRDRAKENIGRLLAGEDLGADEYTALRKNGTTFPVIVHSTPILHEGKPVGFRGIAVDITERKQLEEELGASRERLEYLISSNPALIYVGKPLPDLSDFYAYYQSRNSVSITGFESEQFIGEKGADFWASRVHPDDLVAYRAGTAEFWKQGHRTCEYRFLHKDGTYRWIFEESSVIRDSGGNVKDIIGYWTDITEQRRMKEELQAAKKRLEYVITSNPAVIYAGKPSPDCSDWWSNYISDRVTGMLGFEPRDFIGHPDFWESRVHPDDLRATLAATSHLKEGHYACDYRFLHKDGRYRWIREETRLIRDLDGKPHEVVGCWTDITELKDFEQRLQRTEHLAAIGETAAMVGHDLRNPLQGIAGAAYLLRNESLTEAERSEMLRLIENCLEYADGVVKDLLDYARPFDLVRVRTTPKEIATNALRAVQIPNRITVEDLCQEQPTISVDAERMKRAFVNLLENAVDAMPAGGTLTMTSEESGESVKIIFSDTGTGMPNKTMENLWKPLQTTKAKGMGMGLAICKRIIDAHKGDITVASRTGGGTTVTIRIPTKLNPTSE